MGKRIDIAKCGGFQFSHELAAHVDGVDLKTLSAHIAIAGNGSRLAYSVTKRGVEVFRSEDLERAVEAYNAH